MFIIPILLMMLASSSIVYSGDQFEDYRCKCVCPSMTVVGFNETHRRVYIDVVPPNQCSCDRVVFGAVKAPKDIPPLFCPR